MVKKDSSKDEVFSLSDVLKYKQVGREDFYLVSWDDYGPEDNSWEPRRNIKQAEDETLEKMKRLKKEFHEAAKRRSSDSKTNTTHTSTNTTNNTPPDTTTSTGRGGTETNNNTGGRGGATTPRNRKDGRGGGRRGTQKKRRRSLDEVMVDELPDSSSFYPSSGAPGLSEEGVVVDSVRKTGDGAIIIGALCSSREGTSSHQDFGLDHFRHMYPQALLDFLLNNLQFMPIPPPYHNN
eukprot:GHVQ01008413.1.p1 GENE.GHVQ01008413.1~~GHVQ01008413.1.p1  ORF type:complete len:236 (-),score=63.70 GHVQ01008413.1:580-1287(-)